MSMDNLAKPAAVSPEKLVSGGRIWLFAAAASFAGFALMAWLVLSGRADEMDRVLILMVSITANMHSDPALTDAMRVLTSFGGVVIRSLAALLAASGLWLLERKRSAIVLAGTVAAGWGANSLVKVAVARPRPDIVDHLAQASGPSFPSGHSFSSAVVYVSIALACGALSRRASTRQGLLMAAMFFSAIIAFSRVWLGVHWPSDVVAGWLGGMGWAFAAHGLMHDGTDQRLNTG